MTAARRLPQAAVDAAEAAIRSADEEQWARLGAGIDHPSRVAEEWARVEGERALSAGLSALVPPEWFIAPAYRGRDMILGLWSDGDPPRLVQERVDMAPEVWALLATLVPARDAS